jgi:hypothetical protein
MSNFALPKFSTAEQQKKKWILWGIIGGVGLFVVPLLILTVVAVNRNAQATEVVRRQMEERARAESVRSEEAAAQEKAERAAKALALANPEVLPPRAEETAKAASSNSKSSKSHSRGRHSKSRGKSVANGSAPAAKAEPAKRRNDDIDNLLKGFR